MSIACVLAHEDYGYRMFRQEYLNDIDNSIVAPPKWKDKFRASLNVAKINPNITRLEQYHLILSFIYRS